MDPKVEYINWKRLVITTLLVVVAASLTSSITWFLLDRTFNESQESNEQLVSGLERKISTLSKRLDEEGVSTPVANGNGMISGKITYPSSGIPVKTKIFAEDTASGRTYEATVVFGETTTDMAPSATYTVSVPAGSYYVYGTLPDFNDQNGTPWKAYYNQFVVCGMAATCKDVTKVVLNVEASGKVVNITIGDWYPTK